MLETPWLKAGGDHPKTLQYRSNASNVGTLARAMFHPRLDKPVAWWYNDTMIRLTLRLPENAYRNIKALAFLHRRSINSEILTAIEHYVLCVQGDYHEASQMPGVRDCNAASQSKSNG